MKKLFKILLCTVAFACVFALAACSSCSEESVTSIEDVKVSGIRFQFSELSCDDSELKAEYAAVLEGCVYEFNSDLTGNFIAADETNSSAFTYEIVTYTVGSHYGVSVKFDKQGVFYSIGEVYVPSSLTFTNAGNLTYEHLYNGTQITIKFVPVTE